MSDGDDRYGEAIALTQLGEPFTAGGAHGEYVDAAAATVSVEDRGFLFADACYEVTAIFDGTLIALDRHLARLQRGLDTLRIEFDTSTGYEICSDEVTEEFGEELFEDCGVPW